MCHTRTVLPAGAAGRQFYNVVLSARCAHGCVHERAKNRPNTTWYTHAHVHTFFGLHQNLTYVTVRPLTGIRGCEIPNPGDVAETRGFPLSVPTAKDVKKACRTRATHCTDRAQTSSTVTPRSVLCPAPLTFRIKRYEHEEMRPKTEARKK